MVDGPLCLETGFIQTWHLVPAITDDLIRAEHRINLLSEELAELKARGRVRRPRNGPLRNLWGRSRAL